MKTVKLNQEAWELLVMWKLETKSKNFSEAILKMDELHLEALMKIGEKENDKSKK